MSSLNSHLLSSSASTASGRSPSSPHSSASHSSFSSSDRSSYLMPWRRNFERHRDASRRHQEAVVDGLVEAVGVGGHAVLEIEQPVGVVVDLVLGRRGQADQQRVELVEDRAVLLVDRAVRLVDDDQVEVARAESALAVVGLVDQAHHRRIGRDVDPAVGGLLGHQVDRWWRRAGAS